MGVNWRTEAVDQSLSGVTEDVVVRDLAPLLGLDPLRAQPVQPAPLLELRPQPDHVEKRLLPREAADRGAVVGVEVAVDRDPARLRKLDCFSYLTPFKVLFAQSYSLSAGAGADTFQRRPIPARAGTRGYSARSSIRADRSKGAQLARPVRVLWPKVEIVRCDPRRRKLDAADDKVVVGRNFAQLAAAHVEQDEPWIPAAWKESPASGEAVDAQLQRVGLAQRGVERGVRLEIDQRYLPVHLADAVDHSAYPRAAERHVEA